MFRNRSPAGLAILYAIFGVVWIVATDGLVARLTDDPRTLSLLQTRKGWFFVAVSSFLVYGFTRLARATEREQKTAALESRRRLREAQRVGKVGDWVLDLDHDVLTWSEEVYRIFGTDRQEMEPSFQGFMSFVHPDDRDGLMQAQDGALAEGQPLDHQHRIITGSGEVRWVHERAERFPPDEREPDRLVGTVHDVTEQRRIEEELRRARDDFSAMLEHLPDVVIRLDRSLRYLYVNEAFSRFSGLDGSEVLGRTLMETGLGRPGGSDPLSRAVVQSFQTRRPRTELAFLDSASGRQWFEAHMVPELGLSSDPESILVIGRDVTERIQAQEEVRRFYDRLQEAREEERARISRELHDDLGARLTGLRMDLSQLRRAVPGTSPVQERLRLMDELLGETIRAVRRLSTELRPGVLDELGLAAALEWLCQDFERRGEVACHFEGGGVNLSHLSPVRASHAFRVVQEALTNVRRHAEAHRVEVRLEQEEGSLRFEIVDDGVGFTPAREARSDGLGVRHMHERAVAMGGTLDIDSEGPTGTVVRLTIPVPEGEVAS